MYTAYFGLSALPFSIAPDPDYLFMSDRHREALSHLTYGLGTTGGFVLLTGEVGTGKTTISRRLMAQLPENTQTAFILNPTLSSQELLATICDELKIRYRKTGATLKTLTDKIQEKLLKNHKDNINTLLIIDEAQHLQAEVLEQLRLLTNLETNTKKLLQVILIGQPELQQLLQRRDLRQLAQRITARYHLMPLNKQEVAQYIQHRLSVADCYRVVFDKSAVAIIHQLSLGIPRLINLLCDRSLWIAYGDSKSVVNRKIVIKASSEALGEEYQVTSWWGKPLKVAATVLFSGGLIFSGVWWGQHPELNLGNLVSTTEHNKNEDNLTETVKGQSIEDKAKTIAVAPTVQNSVNKPAITNEIVEQQPNQPIEQNKQPLVLGYKSEQYQQAHQIKATTNTTTANTTQNIADNAEKYQVKAVKGVSAGLLKTFNNVLNETNNTKGQDTISVDETKKTKLPIKPLSQMPQWLQQALPSLHFEMHIYASDGQGWVRVNGRDAREGEKIAENLILEKIEPQKVLLNFRGEEFTMPALSSW